MSRFLTPNVLYTDTDSIITTVPLSDSYISPNLGHFKLEHRLSSSIFLGPKMYSFLTKGQHSISKCSGINSSQLSHSFFTDLLFSNQSTSLSHLKFFPDISSSTVHIKDTLFSLRLRNLSRSKVFSPSVNSRSFWSSTKPFVLCDGLLT